MRGDSPFTLVIDTDPGIDDALALWLAARSPELRLVAVSTSYGNTTLERATRNASEILARAGVHIPVFPGTDRPSCRPLVTAAETHGESGLGYAEVPPAAAVAADPDGLLRALDHAPEPATLVTLGPLTNLALALATHPGEVRRRVARHVAMAGTLQAHGNVTPVTEFNAWCDPESLGRVVEAGLDTTLVPLDATRALVLSDTDVAMLERASDPDAQWLARALRFYVEFHQRAEGLDGCVVNDPLPVLFLLEPTLLALGRTTLKVMLDSGDARGRTAPVPGGHPITVATHADGTRARALLRERVLPWIPA